jgi:mycofactocin precursor
MHGPDESEVYLMDETAVSAIPEPNTPNNDPAFLQQAPEETQEEQPPLVELALDEDLLLEEEFDEEELIIEDFTIDGICGVY